MSHEATLGDGFDHGRARQLRAEHGVQARHEVASHEVAPGASARRDGSSVRGFRGRNLGRFTPAPSRRAAAPHRLLLHRDRRRHAGRVRVHQSDLRFRLPSDSIGPAARQQADLHAARRGVLRVRADCADRGHRVRRAVRDVPGLAAHRAGAVSAAQDLCRLVHSPDDRRIHRRRALQPLHRVPVDDRVLSPASTPARSRSCRSWTTCSACTPRCCSAWAWCFRCRRSCSSWRRWGW